MMLISPSRRLLVLALAGLVLLCLPARTQATGAWTLWGNAEGPARREHSLVIDSSTRTAYVFGGFPGTHGSNDPGTQDLWRLDLAQVSPVWQPVSTAGTRPSGRWGHGAIWDPIRSRMLVFGGWDGSIRNDLWSFSPASPAEWQELATPGTPPPVRMRFGMAYDPVRDRVIVVGGQGAGAPFSNPGTHYADVWELPLSGPSALIWAPILAGGRVFTERSVWGLSYDSVYDRLMLWGGFSSAEGWPRQLWTLSLSGTPAWTRITSFGGGDIPSARTAHLAIYDPLQEELIVAGGIEGSWGNHIGDLWSLPLPPPGSQMWWTPDVPPGSAPSARSGMQAAYDVAGGRLIMHGGETFGQLLGETWSLQTATPPVSVESSTPDRIELTGPFPNPGSAGSWTVEFTLPTHSQARLEVLDIGGRRVVSRELGGLPPGTHRIALGEGLRLTAGVYLIRLEAGGISRTAKALVIH